MKTITRSVIAICAVVGLVGLVGCGAQGSAPEEETDSGNAAAYDGPPLPEGMDSIRFGWAELTDYSSRNPTNDEVEGLYVETARNIAENLGVELVLQEDTWPTIVLGLEADRYDFTFVGKTALREEQSDFTDSLIEADFTLAVRDGEEDQYPDLETLDVAGNVIAVTTGSNTDEALTPLVENAEILRVKDVGGALLSVENGQAQAMAGVRDYLIASTEGYNMTIVDSAWGTSEQGITVAPGNEELLAVMQHQVERMKEEGVIASLIEEVGLVGVRATE